mmetsp:Transcript_12298/g.19376  ORF Transcript_12298/g.19376 Transcript_12298/m.19376 type:complete len:250 (+) Transcript_12298:1144-1893(+)
MNHTSQASCKHPAMTRNCTRIKPALATDYFRREKYSYILVRPGTFRMNQCVEINKEIHIQGEDGARLQGTWFFKAGHSKCTIKNVTLIHEAEPDIQTEGYQRMIHIVMGELVVSDCAILCPGGYPLWAANRAAVTVSDCIVAGAEDCTSKMASGVVAMEFSRLFIRNTRIESAEECCVFVDNDAEVKLKKCCLQSGDVGVMLRLTANPAPVPCFLRPTSQVSNRHTALQSLTPPASNDSVILIPAPNTR